MPSRGERNNNPGNLKASPWTQSLPGYVGADSGGFAIFDSAANGIDAQVKLLHNYYNKGLTTIKSIVGKYSPDGNETNYANYLSSQLGVNPSDTIGSGAIDSLAAAMRSFETGNKNGSTGTDAGSTDTSGGVMASIGNALTPTWLQDLLSGHTAARFTAVVIGVVLIGLAIAAFTLTSGDVKKAALAVAA